MQSAFSPLVTEHKLDSDELADLIRAAIEAGYTANFTAPGSSMMPFIRSEDKIFVAPVSKESIRHGDILVFVRIPDNRVIAHRVVKITGNRFLCKGDNVAVHSDGWISFEDVLGRVEKVERNGKPIRFGVRSGKRLIAWLSLHKGLVPLINALRRVKWGIIRLFSPEDRLKP